MKKSKKRKPKSIGKLKEDAARLLQKLRQMELSDCNGWCQCVTCGKKDFWRNMQGGHFIERGRSSTLLVEENINPQCPGCNCFLMKKASGVLVYRRFMVDQYGSGFVVDLEQKASELKKWSRVDLMELIKEFKSRIKEQEERIGDF